MPTLCPACHGSATLRVADHYQTQIRLPEADPALLAPLAPPLRRSILLGTLSITLFWMAALCPGFVAASRALMITLTFAAGGLLAFLAWRRARTADRQRLADYQQAQLCLDCGARF